MLVLVEKRFALDVGAQHHRAGIRLKFGRQRVGERRFTGAGEPSDREQARRRRFDASPRELEICARAVRDPAGLIRCGMCKPRRSHLGADRGA
jgi:hypothetical protein